MRYFWTIILLFFVGFFLAQEKTFDEEKVKLFRQTGISNFFEYNYEGAVQKLSYVIRFHPDDHEAFYYRALSKIELGDPKSAINDLNKCLILEEENADYYYKIGDLQLILGKYENAIKIFTDAIKLCENKPTEVHKKLLPQLYFQRAFANMQMTNTIGACEDLKKAASLNFLEATKVVKKYCK